MEKPKRYMDNFENSKQKASEKKNGLFHFDAQNENLWVLKPGSVFGRTLNFANPLAYIFLLIALLVLILATRLINSL